MSNLLDYCACGECLARATRTITAHDLEARLGVRLVLLGVTTCEGVGFVVAETAQDVTRRDAKPPELVLFPVDPDVAQRGVA